MLTGDVSVERSCTKYTMKGLVFLYAVLAFCVLQTTANLIECPDNGIHFVQHPKTCSKFVKCDNGLYQEINCREGHWFDLKRGLCDDMNNVECTIEENPSKIQCPGKGDYFLPHPTNCDQFVQCTDGNYIIANCHDGLHFNPAVGWCQDPSIAGCLEEDNKHLIECPENGIYFVQHPKTCSKFVKCNNGLYKEINCREGHWFDPKRGLCDDMNNVECTIEENPSKIQCPGKGDYFLPHPTNCNQFVQCTDGNYIIANCHDGLHFNPALGWCQDPSIAGCLEEDNKPLFECPGDSQMFFPHPTSCSDFIECNLGEYRVLSCGPDLHWNPAAGHCDAPENANCEELPPVTEAPEGLFECPGDSQMFFPHPTSCSDFIECNLGEYRVLSCGPDLHWNPAAGHCDAPENANCEELPPVTEAPEGLFECPGDSQMFFPHPTSCSYFIECNLGEYRVLSCGPDLHWNTAAGHCDAPENANCEELPPVTEAPEGLFECPGDSQMFFPHPTSCSHFIECNLGEYRVLSCGPDHHWNTAAGHCDAPENANCEELPPVTEAPEGLFECPGDSHMFFPHPTSCSHFIECKLGTYRVLYCGTDLHWNAAAGHCDLPINANCEEFPSVTEDPEGIFECPGDSHMFFPHPTSCSHFIECKLGEYKVFPCERDLHWNAAAGHCDRPENANCKELPPIPDKEPPLLVCPEATQKFFPHPNNCSLFIECNFGEYSVLECTEDLHWNDATGYCDFPRYANCEVFPPDTEEESDQIDCPGDTQKFFPHPTNCSLFIECNFGRYSVLRCMKDFHWNDAAGHCDFQENANCEVQPPTTEEQPALLECPGDTQKFFPHPSNCSLFIECNFGRYSVLECMKDFHWNEAVGHCDFPKNANCEQLPPVTEESPGSLLECPDDTQMFFAHPTNCSLFIECNFGVYRVLQCMKDFHWNDHVGHCDFQENTNCDRSNGTGPEPFACPGDTQKFFPHPTNCSLFIECNFAEYRILQCMKDFHWNEIAGHCDFPDNANCEVAATDPPASTTDSTSGETTILETTGTSTIETSSSRTDSTISTTWTDRPILSTSTPPSSSPGAIATESTVDSSTTTTDMSTETSSETTTDMPIGSTTNKGSETDGSTGTTWTDKPTPGISTEMTSSTDTSTGSTVTSPITTTDMPTDSTTEISSETTTDMPIDSTTNKGSETDGSTGTTWTDKPTPGISTEMTSSTDTSTGSTVTSPITTTNIPTDSTTETSSEATTDMPIDSTTNKGSETDGSTGTTWTDKPTPGISTEITSSTDTSTGSTVTSPITTTDMPTDSTTEISSETTTDMPIGSTTNKGSETDGSTGTTWTDKPTPGISTEMTSSTDTTAYSTVTSSITTTDMPTDSRTETSSETTTNMPIGSTTNKGSETDGSTGTTWTDKPTPGISISTETSTETSSTETTSETRTESSSIDYWSTWGSWLYNAVKD